MLKSEPFPRTNPGGGSEPRSIRNIKLKSEPILFINTEF
jgi:hypothetical protein